MVSESQNASGVVLPWEQLAIQGEEMPNDLPFPDQVLFQALSCLYARYHLKKISRERATLEKKKLLDKYRICRFQEQLGEERVRIIKNTELARAEFRKNPSVENGFRLVAAIEGRSIP